MSKKDDSMRRPAKGPRIGLAQIAPALGDLAGNMDRHRAAVDKAVADCCDLLVFPELGLAGYRLKDSVPDVAVTRDSQTWKELESLSTRVALVVGLVEETPDHLFYNSAAYFEGGRCLAVHRKTYLPTYGMFDEQRYFARGRGIAAFDTGCGRVALLVCEDMLHPSAVTIAACDGATVLIVPSASPARGVTTDGEADSNARSWESYLQVMARSFGVWVVYCNRVGVEDGVSFWGGSEIVSPAGESLAKAGYYDEGYVSAVLADDAVRRRRIVNPLVRDEDLDLTINELCRIRGRAVEKAARESDAASRRPERAAPAGGFDAPRPGRFEHDDDDRSPPRKPFGQFGDRDRDRDDAPRGRFGTRERGSGPRGGFGARDRDDGPRGGFGSRDRDDGPRGGFGPRSRDDAPRGGFGSRDRDDGPRGGFGPRGRDDAPRGRFAGQGRDDAPRGRFGARGRDDAPRPRSGGFGPPRTAGGFAPPRRSPGAPFHKDDRGDQARSFKPRFGDAPPRQRQRPEPSRKPFHKGSKPRGRGRKDD